MFTHSNLPGQAAEYEEEINPATWRKIELLLIHPDGSYSQIILLRPLTWLSQITPDGRVWLNLPEMSCVGWASVRSIRPCPLEEGAGRIITGTFRHSHGQVLDVSIQTPQGKITLGATAAHPFWSDDRHDFVPAANLRQGERLRTLFGRAQVVSIIPRGPPEPVYNLEVSTDHSYLVDRVGVLVHNNSADDCVAFAHGTSISSARDIAQNGLDASKARANSMGGKWSHPGAFDAYSIGPPPGGPGFNEAYAMGAVKQATSGDRAVLVGKLPRQMFNDLEAQGLIQRHTPPGTFEHIRILPEAYPIVNPSAQWQVVGPLR